MTRPFLRTATIRLFVTAVTVALAACAPLGLPQPGAMNPTDAVVVAMPGYPAPSPWTEFPARPSPTEPEPTAVPPAQFHTGSEVVTDGLGYYSLTVPANWWAMSRPGSSHVGLADYNMETIDPPAEGAFTVSFSVVDLPTDRDIKGILANEVELGRRNPDGLVGPTPVVIEDVVEMTFVGLQGVGYRAYPPEALTFAAVIDKEHYLLVRTYSTWAQDAPSWRVLDTLVVTLQ